MIFYVIHEVVWISLAVLKYGCKKSILATRLRILLSRDYDLKDLVVNINEV